MRVLQTASSPTHGGQQRAAAGVLLEDASRAGVGDKDATQPLSCLRVAISGERCARRAGRAHPCADAGVTGRRRSPAAETNGGVVTGDAGASRSSPASPCVERGGPPSTRGRTVCVAGDRSNSPSHSAIEQDKLGGLVL